MAERLEPLVAALEVPGPTDGDRDHRLPVHVRGYEGQQRGRAEVDVVQTLATLGLSRFADVEPAAR